MHIKPVNQKLLQRLKLEEVEVDIIQAEVRQSVFRSSELMHDLVIGLFINRYEFGILI